MQLLEKLVFVNQLLNTKTAVWCYRKKTENGLTFKNMQVLAYSQAFCYYYLQKIYTAKVVFKINQTDKNQII